MSEKSVFEKIIEGLIPSEKVFENDRVIAIKDLYPAAPVHLLIIPKKKIRDLQSMKEEDFSLLAEVVRVAQLLAKEFKITEGYRLITNNGPGAGQTIFHLHFHLLGGRKLSELG